MDTTHDADASHDPSIGHVGRIAAWVLTAFVVCEFGAVTGIIFILMPAFMDIFKDFDTPLPWLTLVLINWYPVIAGANCLIAVAAVVKDLLLPRPLDRVIVNLVLVVMGFVSILFMWIALYLPLVSIIQSVTR